MYDTSVSALALLLGQNSVAYQVGRDQRQSQRVPIKPSGINGRCKYRPRAWWQPGNNFPINAKDLVALRDTVAPKGGWTRTPLAPPLAKGELHGNGGSTETDMRIQSSRAICSQISGLSFDAGCPSETEASSSPCHQRRLRLWSYEGWGMRAVKQRLYRFCQGPPHRHRWLVGTLAQRQAANSTDAGALVSVQKEKTHKDYSRVRFFLLFVTNNQILWRSFWVIMLSAKQNVVSKVHNVMYKKNF